MSAQEMFELAGVSAIFVALLVAVGAAVCVVFSDDDKSRQSCQSCKSCPTQNKGAE